MTVPEGLADLSDPLEQNLRRELPNSHLVGRIWSSVGSLVTSMGYCIGRGDGKFT